MKTLQLIIKGKVQGVFFRDTAKDVAKQIGVSGWIRNIDEGSVEALVTGTEEQTKQFIEWCSKGPSRANVTDVVVTEKELKILDKFSVVK